MRRTSEPCSNGSAAYKIYPSQVRGTLQVPASKSHTLRAILFASLAKNSSRLKNLLPSPDSMAMIRAMTMLGASFDTSSDLLVFGTDGRIQSPEDVIDAGNSGITLRFVGALAALQNRYAILTGDASIRNLRPVKPLLDALNQLGATAISAGLDDRAPIMIRGPILHNQATLFGEDSQPVSGLLIAGAFSPHPIRLFVKNPGEKPWVALTLYWFDRLSIPYKNKNYEEYEIYGNSSIESFDLTIPGDFSSAAFPIAAALITQSELTLKGLDPKDPQGDRRLIDVLQQMGANIEWEKETLHIYPTKRLKAIEIDVNDFIDAVPILAVIACFAEGKTHLFNAAIARKKECDRLQKITMELKKMGARIEESFDSLVIEGKTDLRGAYLNAHFDHRIALSLCVAALAATSESTLNGINCITKSYPSFFEDFRRIGANINLHF